MFCVFGVVNESGQNSEFSERSECAVLRVGVKNLRDDTQDKVP